MFCQFRYLVFVLSLGLSLAIPHNEDIKSGSNPCPHGWVPATYVDMGCLKFNTTNPMTWYDANTYCQKVENGILVEIQTAEQFEFLIIQAELVDGLVGGHHYWTGATDQGREDQWYWVNSLTPVGDFMWHSGEPGSGHEYNCMVLWYSAAYEGFDRPC